MLSSKLSDDFRQKIDEDPHFFDSQMADIGSMGKLVLLEIIGYKIKD